MYHLTTSSTILYLYITQPFQSALFLISTSPGHISVSSYYQQYHSASVHYSALPISPHSHLHITRPYQCITLLPAVPFCICTSLSPSNQPSFSSPLHQAIPVYHLTTSSTILYLYITQLFQSALFLISTSTGHTSVSHYYQQYHSISVHVVVVVDPTPPTCCQQSPAPESNGSQQSLPPGGKERLHFVGIRPEVQARKGGW